jgi:transcriptional regulator with XRE-family HTH domain
MTTARIPLGRPEHLASAIRAWRTEAGLSQAALARHLRTTQSAVSRWESGRDQPRLGTLAGILRACGLTAVLVVESDVDRTQIRQQLTLSPRARLETLANVSRMRSVARRVG